MSAPPGALLLLIAFGAGLVTGLSRFLDPVFGVLVLATACYIVRRHWWMVLLFGFAFGLSFASWEIARRDTRCAHRLPLGEAILTLELVDPAASTGRVLLPGTCAGSVMARWPRTTALPAGTSARVTARWLPREQWLGFRTGTLVVRRVDAQWGSPGTIPTLRNRIAVATDALYGRRAPMVEALLVGWRGELDPTVREAFAAAGLVHLLAISGFHVGLLAGWVLLVLRLLRMRRHHAEFGAAIVAIAYAVFLGWPPPAARAAILIFLGAFCRWRQRQVTPTALLASSALAVVLTDLAAIVSIGAWLSVLALTGLTAAVRWSDRAVSRGALARAISSSIGATVATAPVTAFAFGQVAPIGILLNLLAVPVAALLVPSLLASLLLHDLFPATAAALAASGGLLLGLLEGVARFGATLPGAAVLGQQGAGAAAPWLLLAAGGMIALAGRSTTREAVRRLAWGGVFALWLLLLPAANGPAPLGEGRLALVFVDVGQGDATLIRTPRGRWIVVDAGPADARWNAGERVVLPLLRRYGAARIEAMLISHAHRDHVGGAAAITAALPLGLALEPGEHFADASYLGWLDTLASRGVRWQPVEAGREWSLDGVRFRVVHPPADWPHAGDDLNEDSAVLEVVWGEFRALLMGDAGEVAERRLVPGIGVADLLKVGHHGSRTASSASFLGAVTPQAAVISVGRNRYGHPTPEAMRRLASVGARIWRTDRDGHITVESDGKTFTVGGASGSATYTAGRRAVPRR